MDLDELIDLSTEGRFEVSVDAEDAAWALQRSGRNRNASSHHVTELRERMKRGEWVDLHDDPIMFDRQGRLVNGQHRMLALMALEGITIKAYVRTMVDDNRLAATDTVRARSVTDNLAILHGIRASTFETASVAYWDRENGTIRPVKRQRGVAVWEYQEVAAQCPKQVALLREFGKIRRASVRVSGVGVALLVAATHDLDAAREFFLELIDPASSVLQAQFRFRTLTEARRFACAKGHDEQVLRFRYTLTAFDCWRHGQPLTKWGKLLEALTND